MSSNEKPKTKKNPISRMWLRYKGIIGITSKTHTNNQMDDIRNAYKTGAAAMFYLMDEATNLGTDAEVMSAIETIADEVEVIGKGLDEGMFGEAAVSENATKH